MALGVGSSRVDSTRGGEQREVGGRGVASAGPRSQSGGPLVLAVSGLGKGAPLSASNRTPNKKHDDCPNGRANQTGPLACAIPAESLS